MVEKKGEGFLRNQHKWTKLAGEIVIWFAVAATYILTAKLGLVLASLPGNVTAVWPPSGFSLAAVLLLGDRLWPGIFLGSFLSATLDLRSMTPPIALPAALAIALVISIGSALHPLVVSGLIKRFVPRRSLLTQVRGVSLFLLFLGIGPMVNATLGLTALCMGGITPWSDYAVAWLTWWCSGILTPLLLATPFLAWQHRQLHKFKASAAKLLEAIAFSALLLLLSWVCFIQGYAIEYALLPMLVWSVFRFGKFTTTLFVLLVCTIAIVATGQGYGPFIKPSTHESLVLLQSFMGVCAITALILSAAIDERQVAERKMHRANLQLQESKSRLFQILEAIPVGVVVHERSGNISYLNPTAQELLNAPADSQNAPEPTAEAYNIYRAGTDRLYPKAELPFLRSLGGDRVRTDDLELHHGDRRISLDVASTPIFDEGHAVDGAIVAFQDITDRKKAQQLLADYNLTLEEQVAKRTAELEQTLRELQRTQAQLIHTEKMSSLGHMVGGVAHEINNPISFIYGNITHAGEYMQDLLELISTYQQEYPEPTPTIQDLTEEIELEFIIEDLDRLFHSMKIGADRIRKIVLSLRNFSRLDEAAMKAVDINEGIDSTLMLLQSRLNSKPNGSAIHIEKAYGELPQVTCYASEINQVFINILNNAVDALQSHPMDGQSPTIRISTEVNNCDRIVIRISDNGPGIPESVRGKIFDPFFTTKPIGSGTGLGLSVSYQIVVEKHGGELTCISSPGVGTEFTISLPRAIAVK
ncbi:MASE1 domain-containing protein [Phormidium sp. CCY1219]|uniref:MASE1 domain-containing protein n=1 Tax=Phormidium sp. CCY1219 TaxID=2886104 RepID=UPI002D767346|nr:MASE1 domain-containing protein [Phormidium sp. CCY1219]